MLSPLLNDSTLFLIKCTLWPEWGVDSFVPVMADFLKTVHVDCYV